MMRWNGIGGRLLCFAAAGPAATTPAAAQIDYHNLDDERHEAMEAEKMGGMDDTIPNQEPGMAHGKRHEMPAMQHSDTDSAHAAESDKMRRMMDLQMRMMADPVIRQRVMADTALRRLIHETMAEIPAEHGEHMRGMMEGDRKGEPKDSAAHREHEMQHL